MNDKHKKREQTALLVLSSLGLFSLLVYTFVHTGGLFARYVQPVFVGYIAAFGIEATIAGMSYKLAGLKKSQKQNGFLSFVLGAALLVSAFANIEEGYRVMYKQPLVLANIWQIDPVQAFIGLSATGLISLLVFAISEIIGSDVNAVTKVTERAKKQDEPEIQTVVEQPRPEVFADEGRYKQMVYSVLSSGEQLGPRPMAERVRCSPATAKKWIDSYRAEQGQTPNGKH